VLKVWGRRNRKKKDGPGDNMHHAGIAIGRYCGGTKSESSRRAEASKDSCREEGKSVQQWGEKSAISGKGQTIPAGMETDFLHHGHCGKRQGA